MEIDTGQLQTISLTANQKGEVQFGRIIEVDVLNFKTKSKITLGNAFNIEFDFFKSIDEVRNASTGQIRIYGLTEQTRNLITEPNSEVILRYGYGRRENLKTLFIANLISKSAEFKNGTVVTTLNVSCNFAEFRFNKVSISNHETTIGGDAVTIVSASQETNDRVYEVVFNLEHVPKEYQPQIEQMIKTKRVRSYLSTTSKYTALSIFVTKYGLTALIQKPETGEMAKVTFTIPPEAVGVWVSWATTGYSTISSESEVQFKTLYESTNENDAIVFNEDTGLLGSPILDTQLINVPENWNLGKNEQVTRKGQETILNKNQKRLERQRKNAKRIKEGKKPLKATNKMFKKQISRTFVKVKASINPSVAPQSYVKLESTLSEYDGFYRVRSITYKGTNGSGESYMEMYCEDSNGSHDKIVDKPNDDSHQPYTINGGLGEEGLQEGVSMESYE